MGINKMNILAIGAHFDDVELGCGGSLLKWKKAGHDVSLFVATQSGYQDSRGKSVRTDEDARAEGIKAAKHLGAALYEGGLKTFDVEFNETLNRKLLQVVETAKPDLVLTHWMNDAHHDHQALSSASLHCCRHVPRLLTYRSNWYDGKSQFKPTFYVDISSQLEKKVKLIQLHRSEFIRTDGKWEDFVRSQAVLAGLKTGCRYAESFEAIRWMEY
jgi:LmbE family N-acetylglucosaminyl deacetylase